MSLFRFTRVVTVLMICFALGSCGSSARSSNSSNPSSCWLKCTITNPHSLRFGISTAQFWDEMLVIFGNVSVAI